MKLIKYSLWCADHNLTVYTDYIPEAEGQPTKCPLNETHVTISDVTVADVIDTDPQRVQQVDFPDMSIYDFLRKSWRHSIAVGENTWLIKYDIDVMLYGGKYRVDGTVHDDDYCEFGIVDHDDVLGYGIDFEVVRYVDSEYVHAGQQEIITAAGGAKLVPKELYFRTKYIAAGTATDRKITVRYFVERVTS